MSRPIVTIFEQYGAGAVRIAPAVAERLGVPFLGQRLTSEDIEAADQEAARQARPFDSFLRSFSFMGTPDSDLAQGVDARADYEMVMENTASVLKAVKDTGGVVVGRNGTVILARAAGSLHCRLIAPLDVRIERGAAEGGVDRERAAKRQRYEDRIRAEMSQRLYQWDPDDDQYYDLVLNTGTFGIAETVELIVAAYRVKYPVGAQGA